MKYSLNNAPAAQGAAGTRPLRSALRAFLPLLRGEHGKLAVSLAAILLNSGLNLAAPLLMARAIDVYVLSRDFGGVLRIGAALLAVYLLASAAAYVQTLVMGGVSQRMLFSLRNAIFEKLQSLPVAFFNQNKAGDLISRINNDTDKLNQFFSQALMQFVGNVFMIAGTGVVMVAVSPRLGMAALLPAAGLLVLTRLLSGWVKRANARSLEAVGGLSANVQESLDTFKVVVAFHRRDYFRDQFRAANDRTFDASVSAGAANNVFVPSYGLAANLALLTVVAYGAHLVSAGALSIGVLIGFLTYVTRFYDPLRHIASLWATFQTALAGWDRISAILVLRSDLPVVPAPAAAAAAAPLLEFKDVRFAYEGGREVLHRANLSLEAGKTYAFVGPTGGGKTTTASLMARLYDPTSGTVLLGGRDLRSYEPSERARKIGFILQEPFLFAGTLRENLLYGNGAHGALDAAGLADLLRARGLDGLLARFDQGLDTPLRAGGEGLSLGQRQLAAFIRAALRDPELLILDEATANIDTLTEQLLEEVLAKFPKETTKVVIAHRLNTIESADEIFFVNAGEITRAGSLQDAVDMLLRHARGS